MLFVYKAIGIGAVWLVRFLAGPLFRRFNEVHYRYLCAHCYRWRAIRTHLLQPDHFKSPSYAPESRHSCI